MKQMYLKCTALLFFSQITMAAYVQKTGTVSTAVSAMNWKTINTKLINTLN